MTKNSIYQFSDRRDIDVMKRERDAYYTRSGKAPSNSDYGRRLLLQMHRAKNIKTAKMSADNSVLEAEKRAKSYTLEALADRIARARRN